MSTGLDFGSSPDDSKRPVRSGPFILVAALVFALLAGAISLYAYDSSREDLIAPGVSVANIDVGGMRADEAREVLRGELLAPLERPIVVTHRGRRFELSPKRAHLRADIGGMVDEAVRASREGTLVSRSWRDLTGGEQPTSVAPRVSYSEEAVRTLVRRVKRKIDRPARDARLTFSASGLGRVGAHAGRELKSGTLKRRVEAALRRPEGDRSLSAPVKVVRPQVTSDELADRYPIVLVVDRRGFKLRLFKRLRQVRTYTIAVGRVGLETPAGLYRVQNKAVDPAWHVPKKAWAGPLAGRVIPGGTAENPLKARWLGIYAGAGIHGTDDAGSLGTAASHGCIRMAIPDVKELYAQVPVQTPVYIA